ncbi:hypothetical protein SprV_0802467700 [Sparganum proliferum]
MASLRCTKTALLSNASCCSKALAIETIELLLQSKYDETENRLGHGQILQLMKFCLPTYFTFDGTIYEQVEGTPMRSPISGFVVEAVLQRLESLVFQTPQTELLGPTKARDEGNVVHAIYIDFKNAFDSAPHQHLLHKLCNAGICGRLLVWIRSFLSGWSQRVQAGRQQSSEVSVTKARDEGNVVHAIYIDFKNAFDSAPHQHLLHKLCNAGICGRLLVWIRSFLSGWSQRVQAGRQQSSEVSVTKARDEGNVVHAIYIDFKNAFDSAPHQHLLHKLCNAGICGRLLVWIRSFLSGWSQRVQAGRQQSSEVSVTVDPSRYLANLISTKLEIAPRKAKARAWSVLNTRPTKPATTEEKEDT